MKRIVNFIFVFLIGLMLHAQSAEVITDILDSPKITYGQACYLSAVAQNLVYEEASYEDAASALYENRQLSFQPKIDDEIQLVNLAFLYTQIFSANNNNIEGKSMYKLKGGLMYRLTKGSPRYALRLLKADGIVPQNYDPAKVLSGREALSLFTSCILQYGEDQFKDSL